MRAYVITTGFIFLVLVGAHAWRIIVEGIHVMAHPEFAITTGVALCMSAWAFWLAFLRAP